MIETSTERCLHLTHEGNQTPRALAVRLPLRPELLPHKDLRVVNVQGDPDACFQRPSQLPERSVQCCAASRQFDIPSGRSYNFMGRELGCAVCAGQPFSAASAGRGSAQVYSPPQSSGGVTLANFRLLERPLACVHGWERFMSEVLSNMRSSMIVTQGARLLAMDLRMLADRCHLPITSPPFRHGTIELFPDGWAASQPHRPAWRFA